MALNINIGSTQKAAQQEEAAQAERTASLQPKTAVERLMEQGPASLEQETISIPVQTKEERIQQLAQERLASGTTDLAEPSNIVELPSIRSGTPNPLFKQQMEESRRRYEEAKFKEAAEKQKEEERVTPYSEIDPRVLDFDTVNNDGFGQSIERSNKFSELFQSNIDKATVSGAYLPVAETMGLRDINPDSTKGILFDSNGFNAGVIREDGVTQVDPLFSRIMGLTTERFIGLNQLFEKPETSQDSPLALEPSEIETEEDSSLRRGIGNSALGRDIFRSWKREQNIAKGLPSDQYTEEGVSNDQFEIIGTLAKEMYHSANPTFYDRITNGDKIIFQLLPDGAAAIKAAKESAPDAFINQEIPPSPAPRPVLKRLGEGEARTIRKEKTTAVVNRKIKQVEEARDNMNSVAHGVDPLRRKIVYQLAIQTLAQLKKGESLPKTGDLFNIGPAKMRSFQGEQAKKANENIFDYDPRYEMEKQVVRFIEFLNTSAKYSNRANHLDFVVQELQTRMHVAQNRFNPQGIPWMRYITGGMVPTQINPSSNSEANLMFKEMMAMYHIPGAKKLLPEERVKAFDREWSAPQHGIFSAIIQAGSDIKNSLMTPEQDNKTIEEMTKIKFENNAISIPPSLQETPALNVPENLLKQAEAENIEGLGLIESAHELYEYDQAQKNNRSFYSNLGVEIDGKTHGPASNLMQLGSIPAAYRVGVLRKVGATKNLDDFTISQLYNGEMVEVEQQAGDIRDGMKAYMLEHGQSNAENFANNTDLTPRLYEILELAVGDRENFLKKPPMTLSYGQLLKNLNGAIKDTLGSGVNGNKIRKIINEPAVRQILVDKAKKNQSPEDVVVEYLHNILADAIDSELHPDIIQVGQLLRANNVVAMLSDEIMTVKNAIGVDNYIGARQSIMTDRKGNISVTLPSGKKVGGVPIYKSSPSGSAMKDGKPGGWGRGRVIPAVIQGIDGAWMNKTFTGNSWKDLKRSYMLPIMDAIKTDLGSARNVRRHANSNWWTTIKDYSYVDEIMGKWTPKTIADFRTKLTNMGNETIELSMDSPYRGFAWLLWKGDQESGPYPNMINTIYDTMYFPPRSKGQSVKEYENQKKYHAKKLVSSMILPKLFKSGKDIDELPANQVKELFDRIIKALNLESRNKQTVAKTKANKDALVNAAKDSTILQIDIG